MKVKRLSICHSAQDSSSGYLVENENTSLLFDPPSVLMDSDIGIGDIVDRGHIEIEVLREYPANVSGIFLSNSVSLSVFFVESNIPIYLTDAIYVQLKERLKYYLSLGLVSRKKRTAQPHTRIVEISQYKKIARRIRLVKFNQIVPFTYMSIIPQPGGVSLGWVMYLMAQGRDKICAYMYGVPGGCSLSQEVKPQNTAVPLIVNRFVSKDKPDIQQLTKDISKMASSTDSFAITMDILSHSVEMALHILSLIKDRNVLVSHPGFKKTMQFYEIKKDLFSNRFVSDPTIISTLFSTARLKPLSLAKILRVLKKEKTVILCDFSFYGLFFRGMPALHLDDYSVRFMGDLNDALSLGWTSKVFTSARQSRTDLHNGSTEVAQIHTDAYEDISENAMHSIKICNTENIHRVGRNNETISLHFAGVFKEESAGLLLECKESPLEMIVSSGQVQKYIINDSVVYNTKDKLFKIKEENGTVDVKIAKNTQR
ncbi:hypothetical protein NEMIN01_0739 [Nematocida minor]|uniref:uncharacterized protein n=1 Tax=Nematocida minor TaxID=1912983 RepID=UPI00222108D0|nr:uncharacterized protein NEMIN01_0739 [Nematocida minor]KAI5189876.1 hypothetical protein NEMIN01_0739 [Nematocida minor]